MFPSEVAVLTAIEATEGLTIKQLNHVTDVTGVHLHYLCNSLGRRGYLKQNDSEGYRITFKGRWAILEARRETTLELRAR